MNKKNNDKLNYIIYALMAIIIVVLLYTTFFNKKVVNGILLSKNKISLYVGESDKLNVNFIPEESSTSVNWNSGSPSIASVDDSGNIIAIKEGKTIITVSTYDGKKDTCEVEVISLVTPTPMITPSPTPTPTATPIPVINIILDKTDLTMVVGSSDTLTITINPTDAYNKEVTWESSNSSIVEVTNGKLNAKTKGTATITVTTIDGKKEASCNVTVLEAKTFDQRNEALKEYMKEPTADKIKKVYNTYKCGKKLSCDKPNAYTTFLQGNIKVYKYNMSNNTKTLLATTTSSELNFYLEPSNTYYLDDGNNVEVVTINGSVRMMDIPKIGNCRDLGGWKADGGTVNYGKIFRSEKTDSLASFSSFEALNIGKNVDLRRASELGYSSRAKQIRQNISTDSYVIGKSSHNREALEAIIKTVVNDKKSVIFNCILGRDRTGTVAYLILGLLGVSSDERAMDYELTYLKSSSSYTRTYSAYKGLENKFKDYNQTQYEQERFINWYLSFSTNKEQDLDLLNQFRKIMINGTPHEYKLVNGNLTLVQ